MNIIYKLKNGRFKKLLSLFQVENMIKEDDCLGHLPSTKRAYSAFFSVAWPSALESLLISLIGSVDTIMVGALGKEAIAAVGITNQPKFILLAMIFALNVGVTAVVARRKGQEDQEGANHTLRAAIILSTVISLVMLFIGFAFANEIMLFAGAEDAYLSDAVIYFRIITVGIVFTSVNITINAAQRGCGNTKIAMRTNIIANVVNVVFNYLLINGIFIFPRLGVKGAAIATSLGAFVACSISIISLFKKNVYLSFLHKSSWRMKRIIIAPVLKVSSSAFVEQVFMRIGFLAYSVIVTRLGTTPYATHLICMNILSLSFAFGDGFGIAASSLVGQNLGAKRPDISSIYGKIGQRIAFLVSTVLFVAFILGRTFFVSLFNTDPDILELGSIIMIIMALSTHFQTSQVVLNGCLRGAGDSAYVAATSLISIAIIRPLLTWVLCFPCGFGLAGAWIALIIDQFFRFSAGLYRFNSGKWAKIKL